MGKAVRRPMNEIDRERWSFAELRDSQARRIVVDRGKRLGDFTGKILRGEKSETTCHYEGVPASAGCKSRPRYIPVATCTVRGTFRRRHATSNVAIASD
jgi:hypothetical protein